MDTKTIDTLIREKARYEFIAKLRRHFDDARSLCGADNYDGFLGVYDDEGRKLKSRYSNMIDELIQLFSPHHENKAVEDFIKKVESFSDQLQELREQQPE